MWFGLIQCDSADSVWFSRFSMIQWIQYDSIDSVWFSRFSMNQFNSKWFSLIQRDFSCMRRKPRPSMQPNIITYADFRIDKVLRKSVIWLQRFFCWNAPRKRSRTRGCLSQKLFTYGKVNFSGAFALRYSTIPSFYACRQFCPEVDLSGLCRPCTNWRGTAGLYITNISLNRPIKI